MKKNVFIEQSEKKQSIIYFLIRKGLTLDQAIYFYELNKNILEEKFKDDNIIFLYNYQELYGLLLVENDEYNWTIYQNGNFQKLHSKLENEECDYVISLVVSFIQSEKLNKMGIIRESFSFTNTVQKLNQLNLHKHGYHFR